MMLVESTKVWNGLLEKSNEQYRLIKKGITNWYDLQQLSKTIKTIHLHSQSKQDVTRRLARSFVLFFKKIKMDKKARSPRFKKETMSITYPQSGFHITGNKLWVSKIGNIPIVLHRSLSGNIKTLTIKKNRAGQYYAYFSSDIIEKKEPAPEDSEVGIDLGCNKFVQFSDGDSINKPQFLLDILHKITKLQRQVSKKKKGSSNRRKAIHKLNRGWQYYDDSKMDFLHQQAANITADYRTIAVEDLDVRNMLVKQAPRSLHRNISDASWNKFVMLLEEKAVIRSGNIKKVDPRNTSKDCSWCGETVPKQLSDRIHDCPNCGLKIDRDLNAAINIAHRAGLARIYACGDTTSTAGSIPAASLVVEARTITRAA